MKLVRVNLNTGVPLIELSCDGLGDCSPFANDLALAGDALLVLSDGQIGRTCIAVLSAETGEMRFSFGEFGSNDAQLRAPESLMVCTAILCTWRTCATTAFRSTSSPRTGGTSVPSVAQDRRPTDDLHSSADGDERIGSAPGEFNEPTGVAISHRRLYVSKN